MHSLFVTSGASDDRSRDGSNLGSTHSVIPASADTYTWTAPEVRRNDNSGMIPFIAVGTGRGVGLPTEGPTQCGRSSVSTTCHGDFLPGIA